MDEKKKNKVLLVIIVLFIIVALGLVGYICYDKGILLSGKEVVQGDKEKESWEDIDLDDDRFYSIYTILKGFTYDKSRKKGMQDFSNQELANLAFAIADVKKSDFTQISVADDGWTTKASFSADIVTPEINKIFNTDISIDYNNLKDISLFNLRNEYGLKISENYLSLCGFSIESYDKETNTIIANFNTGGCGGTSGPHANIIERKIVSAKKNKDTIKVSEKAIYYEAFDVNDKIVYYVYSDNTKTNVIAKLEYTINDVSNQTITVDSYLEQATTIIHTYKLNSKTNQYYFVGSSIA